MDTREATAGSAADGDGNTSMEKGANSPDKCGPQKLSQFRFAVKRSTALAALPSLLKLARPTGYAELLDPYKGTAVEGLKFRVRQNGGRFNATVYTGDDEEDEENDDAQGNTIAGDGTITSLPKPLRQFKVFGQTFLVITPNGQVRTESGVSVNEWVASIKAAACQQVEPIFTPASSTVYTPSTTSDDGSGGQPAILTPTASSTASSTCSLAESQGSTMPRKERAKDSKSSRKQSSHAPPKRSSKHQASSKDRPLSQERDYSQDYGLSKHGPSSTQGHSGNSSSDPQWVKEHKFNFNNADLEHWANELGPTGPQPEWTRNREMRDRMFPMSEERRAELIRTPSPPPREPYPSSFAENYGTDPVYGELSDRDGEFELDHEYYYNPQGSVQYTREVPNSIVNPWEQLENNLYGDKKWATPEPKYETMVGEPIQYDEPEYKIVTHEQYMHRLQQQEIARDNQRKERRNKYYAEQESQLDAAEQGRGEGNEGLQDGEEGGEHSGEFRPRPRTPHNLQGSEYGHPTTQHTNGANNIEVAAGYMYGCPEGCGNLFDSATKLEQHMEDHDVIHDFNMLQLELGTNDTPEVSESRPPSPPGQSRYIEVSKRAALRNQLLFRGGVQHPVHPSAVDVTRFAFAKPDTLPNMNHATEEWQEDRIAKGLPLPPPFPPELFGTDQAPTFATYGDFAASQAQGTRIPNLVPPVGYQPRQQGDQRTKSAYSVPPVNQRPIIPMSAGHGPSSGAQVVAPPRIDCLYPGCSESFATYLDLKFHEEQHKVDDYQKKQNAALGLQPNPQNQAAYSFSSPIAQQPGNLDVPAGFKFDWDSTGGRTTQPKKKADLARQAQLNAQRQMMGQYRMPVADQMQGQPQPGRPIARPRTSSLGPRQRQQQAGQTVQSTGNFGHSFSGKWGQYPQLGSISLGAGGRSYNPFAEKTGQSPPSKKQLRTMTPSSSSGTPQVSSGQPGLIKPEYRCSSCDAMFEDRMQMIAHLKMHITEADNGGIVGSVGGK